MFNILFIGFDYHEYVKAIVIELIKQGYKVSFHSIQPGKIYLKFLRKFLPGLYQKALNNYHTSLIKDESTSKYDIVLFLQVHQFSIDNIILLKESQKDAKFILYNWDALTTHDYSAYLSYFDNIYTFDPKDSKSLNIGYLPLFCIPMFQRLNNRSSSPLSVYFVGNIYNPERYRAIQKFRNYCKNEGIRFQYYLSTSTYGLTLMINNGIIPWDVSLFQISENKFIKMIEESAAVFDYANHMQTGYTMRIIENLCAHKKIITNNTRIKQEIFINEDRAFVFDDLNFEGIKDFLERPLKDKEEDYPDFHIDCFVKKLIEENL